MSHNITGRDIRKPDCGCKSKDLTPSKLDVLINRYKELIKEMSEARDRFIHEALDFEIVEATTKEVEQMFDGIMEDEDYMNLPSMDFDNDGYVSLNISVDSDGYVHFEND